MAPPTKNTAGVCSRCGETDPGKFTPSGLKKRTAWCKPCLAEYKRQRYDGQVLSRAGTYQTTERAKRVDWLRSVKSARGCQRCGERDHACLDFHHEDESTKRFNIGTAIHQVSRARIEEEIAKAIVLCSNCHRKLHFYEKSGAYSGLLKGKPKRPRRKYLILPAQPTD